MERTLIVDDMREVYDKLRGTYPESVYAQNVEDALRIIRAGECDKVLTDYHLGEDSPEGGLDIVREAFRMGIECILMSTENHEEAALKAGATKFVFKGELIEDGRK